MERPAHAADERTARHPDPSRIGPAPERPDAGTVRYPDCSRIAVPSREVDAGKVRSLRGRELATLAGRQRGVVTTAQLHGLGFSPSSVKRLVAGGRLHRIFRGAYLVGHTAAPALARETAALLVVGPAAVLSHHTAAHIHGFAPPSRTIHVTTAARGRRSRPGLTVHHADLMSHEIVTGNGPRRTTGIRTLTDLIPFLDQATLERYANEAQVLKQITHDQLAQAPAPLRRLTDDRGFTRREAERRLKHLLHRAGLKPTATNTKVEGYEVDVLYADRRLIVEMDGFASHRTRHAFERDRRRDARLTAAGYRTIRVTWRQIHEQPELVLATIAAALARP